VDADAARRHLPQFGAAAAAFKGVRGRCGKRDAGARRRLRQIKWPAAVRCDARRLRQGATRMKINFGYLLAGATLAMFLHAAATAAEGGKGAEAASICGEQIDWREGPACRGGRD
jgi:hypothetical protein